MAAANVAEEEEEEEEEEVPLAEEEGGMWDVPWPLLVPVAVVTVLPL